MHGLSETAAEFVGRISVAVWIGRLSDETAREVLLAYAAASQHRLGRVQRANFEGAILAEYRHRREGQDLSS